MDALSVTFESIWLQDKDRVTSLYNDRFMRYVDLEKFRADEEHLESGFDRNCGPKGSKLSGGQK